MEKKIEIGKWKQGTYFLMGIKANDVMFKNLHEDFKIAAITEEAESEIFYLHESVYGLDGYWMGDIDNPDGLVIGYRLYDPQTENELIFGSGEEFDNKSLNRAIEYFHKQCDELFDYKSEMQAFLETTDDVKLYIVTEKQFILKEEIERRAQYDFYPLERKWVEENKWEMREV